MTLHVLPTIAGVRAVVLLTKVDQVCGTTNSDISKMFHSEDIKAVAYKLSGKLAVQIHDVLPVVNYGIYGKIQQDQSVQSESHPQVCNLSVGLRFIYIYAKDGKY